MKNVNHQINSDRVQNDFILRKIQKQNNHDVMTLIKTVLKEFGANRAGFAFADKSLEIMYETYNNSRSAYFVIERLSDNKIVGGGGFADLQNAKDSICELQKMYLLPETRGMGLGSQLLTMLLQEAKDTGYKQCYLETLKTMEAANRLYLDAGFEKLDKPLGDTGHYGCDVWYLKKL